MSSANYSINFTAVLAITAGNVSAFQVGMQTTAGWLPATSANLAGDRPDGVFLSAASAGGTVLVQHGGLLDLSGVTVPGTGNYLSIDALGGMIRTADVTDTNIIGSIKSNNVAQLNFMRPLTPGQGGHSATATGTSIAMGHAVCLANVSGSSAIVPATTANLAAAGGVWGIATQAIAAGSVGAIAVAGDTVAASVSGLPVGAACEVAIAADGSLYRLDGAQYTTVTGANVTLPQSTISVASTAGFPSSGTLSIQPHPFPNNRNINWIPQTVTYTGKTATSFTGCAGGTLTIAAGDPVVLVSSLAVPTGGEFIVGTTDQQGNVTIAQRTHRTTAARHVVNVRTYGAAGDGVTDDTAAIRMTIAIANALGGGVVFLPAGAYKVTASLIPIHDGVHLVGESYAGAAYASASTGHATVIDSYVNTSWVVSVGYSPLGNVNQSNSVEYITFRNRATQTYASYADLILNGNCAVESTGAGFARVKHCKAMNYPIAYVLDGSEELFFDHCFNGGGLAGGYVNYSVDSIGYFLTPASAQNTTIAAGSNGAILPQGTLNVASTTGFPATGTLGVTTSSGVQTVTYTGTTATTFTGCSGGAGTMSTGGTVQLMEGRAYGFAVASSTNGIVIRDCDIGGVTGVYAWGSSTTYVKHCTFEGGTYACRLDGCNNVVLDGSAAESYTGAVVYTGTPCVGITVRDCVLGMTHPVNFNAQGSQRVVFLNNLASGGGAVCINSQNLAYVVSLGNASDGSPWFDNDYIRPSLTMDIITGKTGIGVNRANSGLGAFELYAGDSTKPAWNLKGSNGSAAVDRDSLSYPAANERRYVRGMTSTNTGNEIQSWTHSDQVTLAASAPATLVCGQAVTQDGSYFTATMRVIAFRNDDVTQYASWERRQRFRRVSGTALVALGSISDAYTPDNTDGFFPAPTFDVTGNTLSVSIAGNTANVNAQSHWTVQVDVEGVTR